MLSCRLEAFLTNKIDVCSHVVLLSESSCPLHFSSAELQLFMSPFKIFRSFDRAKNSKQLLSGTDAGGESFSLETFQPRFVFFSWHELYWRNFLQLNLSSRREISQLSSNFSCHTTRLLGHSIERKILSIFCPAGTRDEKVFLLKLFNHSSFSSADMFTFLYQTESESCQNPGME